jgi:hypothetical protein
MVCKTSIEEQRSRLLRADDNLSAPAADESITLLRCLQHVDLSRLLSLPSHRTGDGTGEDQEHQQDTRKNSLLSSRLFEALLSPLQHANPSTTTMVATVSTSTGTPSSSQGHALAASEV